MDIRLLAWNIRLTSKPGLIAAMIRDHWVTGRTIAVLSEVRAAAFEHFFSEFDSRFAFHSLSLRPPGQYEGINRTMGVAVFSDLASNQSPELLWRSVFPERTAICYFESGHRSLTVFGFHALTGVDYKKAKSTNFAEVASFLADNKVDFACFDANEPKVDSLYPDRRVFFDNRDGGKNASLLLGPNSVHGMSESFPEYLRRDPAYEDSDPLATSHVTPGTPRRYDHVLHGDVWQSVRVEYAFDEAIAASSDHAMVICDYIAV